MIRIIDLDNCISNDGWRIARVDWGQTDMDRRYHDYHSLAPFDEYCNRHLIDSAPPTVDKFLFMTARPITFRSATNEWIDRNTDLASYLLVMRNAGQNAPSAELKRQQLMWLIAHYNISLKDILDAYDDREDVVQMYRTHGIAAERAFIHEQCALTRPA